MTGTNVSMRPKLQGMCLICSLPLPSPILWEAGSNPSVASAQLAGSRGRNAQHRSQSSSPVTPQKEGGVKSTWATMLCMTPPPPPTPPTTLGHPGLSEKIQWPGTSPEGSWLGFAEGLSLPLADQGIGRVGRWVWSGRCVQRGETAAIRKENWRQEKDA